MKISDLVNKYSTTQGEILGFLRSKGIAAGSADENIEEGAVKLVSDKFESKQNEKGDESLDFRTDRNGPCRRYVRVVGDDFPVVRDEPRSYVDVLRRDGGDGDLVGLREGNQGGNGDDKGDGQGWKRKVRDLPRDGGEFRKDNVRDVRNDFVQACVGRRGQDRNDDNPVERDEQGPNVDDVELERGDGRRERKRPRRERGNGDHQGDGEGRKRKVRAGDRERVGTRVERDDRLSGILGHGRLEREAHDDDSSGERDDEDVDVEEFEHGGGERGFDRKGDRNGSRNGDGDGDSHGWKRKEQFCDD